VGVRLSGLSLGLMRTRIPLGVTQLKRTVLPHTCKIDPRVVCVPALSSSSRMSTPVRSGSAESLPPTNLGSSPACRTERICVAIDRIHRQTVTGLRRILFLRLPHSGASISSSVCSKARRRCGPLSPPSRLRQRSIHRNILTSLPRPCMSDSLRSLRRAKKFAGKDKFGESRASAYKYVFPCVLTRLLIMGSLGSSSLVVARARYRLQLESLVYRWLPIFHLR
jgi:hypothetical protein